MGPVVVAPWVKSRSTAAGFFSYAAPKAALSKETLSVLSS